MTADARLRTRRRDRPFGSYRPGEEFRDYPFQPTTEDLAVIRGQLRVEEIRE